MHLFQHSLRVLSLGFLLFIPVSQAIRRDQAAFGTQEYTPPTKDTSESVKIAKREVRRYPHNLSFLDELQRTKADIWRVAPEGIDVLVTPDLSRESSILGQLNFTLLPIDLPPVHQENDGLNTPCTRDYARKTRRAKYLNLTLLSHEFHSQYHSARNISHFMHSLVHTFPNHTSLIHIGHSFEGRKLTGVKIAKPESHSLEKKERKGFVILGAQHAREWIATSTALYLAHALAVNASLQTSADSHHSLSHLLDKFEFHIIPLPNPDGHEYTRKHDRLWYKNRQTVSPGRGKEACKGIDMNRNWGFEWSPAQDPSSDPCKHWFPGSRPFEAHEVNALTSYLTYRTGGLGKVVAFLDLRSYGQTLSAPFSYSCDVYPGDAEDQIEAALGAAQASSKVHGITFSSGRLCETLYSAPGNIVDWAYAEAGIKYTYAAHLRDTGTYGYLLPAEFIRPTGEETAALVAYLAAFIAKDPKTM